MSKHYARACRLAIAATVAIAVTAAGAETWASAASPDSGKRDTYHARLAGSTGVPGLAEAARIGSEQAALSGFKPAPLRQEYVALGDSFPAGPLLSGIDQLFPCFRSTNNYPHLVAGSLGVKTFRDVSCSGATTANILTEPQQGMPIQLNALSGRTSLVTLTIGANDADLTGYFLNCIRLWPQELGGKGCKDSYVADGVDKGANAIDAVTPKLKRVLRAIHKRSPHARILVTSYANYIRPESCWPIIPLYPEDGQYIQGLVNRMGANARRLVRTDEFHEYAGYVDLIGPGRGHDGCAADAWATGLLPRLDGALLVHPTHTGMKAFANLILGRLQDVR